MFNFIKKKINQFKINLAFKNSKRKINKGLIQKNQFPLNGIINFDYNYKPKTSIIINYFTSLKTMMKTIDNLRTLGDEIVFIDYAGTFDTYALTIAANGSEKIAGSTADLTVSIERAANTLVYTDGTQGWLLKNK